ncbi:MAG TPA: hypothetical protein VGO28_11990 [Acidimicrobiia bacterium]
MRNGILRVALAVLAFVSVELGVWAAFAPRSFFDDYPGLGRHWVRVDGPYNEHLVRDFGGLNLALAVVTIAALITLGRPLVIAVAVAWLAWGVPHLVYHLRHLDMFSTGDNVGIVAGLAAAPVLAVVVLVLTLQRPARA